MIKFHKKSLRASSLCILFMAANSLHYSYSGYQSRHYPSHLSSAASTVNETVTNSETNRTARTESHRQLESTFPGIFLQRRGGKNLNLTLVTESSRSVYEQARILNNPNQYTNSSVSIQSFKKLPAISPNPPLLQDNSYKWIAPLDKNNYINSNNLPFNHVSKTYSIKDIDSFYSPQRSRETTVNQQNYGQVLPFPAPQKLRTFTSVPISHFLRENYNTKFRQTLPPRLHDTTSSNYYFPPARPETNANWPCFCVPYYLCKNGVINSGGRSVAAVHRRTRSSEYDSRNTTQFPVLVQPKLMKSYIVEQESDPPQCEGRNVCCRVSFADEDPYNRDEKYYPPVTPRTEPFYPHPPRFSGGERERKMCGIRRAYGIHTRLRQLQYPADVSEFGEYPWQIAILRKTEGQKSLYLCGGVLISYQWVATAAHCIKNEQFSPLIIRLGEWDVNRRDEIYPFVEIEVESIIIHPEFNPDTLYNDLALVRMISPVDPRLPHVTPICLPDRETLYDEQRCWVSGWGKDFFGPQGEYQSILKEVDVPVIMQEICTLELRKTHLGPNFNLHPGFLCAGGEAGKDACTGDGGSPLVCKSGQNWYAVGIVSWGIGCGQPGIPGVYVNILYYIDWINSIIGR